MHKKAYLLLASLFTVFLTIISLKESDTFSQNLIPVSDKVRHLLAYVVLTVLWSKYFVLLNFKTGITKTLTLVVAFLMIYGIIIELLQSILTSTRVSEFYDVIANFIGIVFGIVLFLSINKSKLKSNKGLFF